MVFKPSIPRLTLERRVRKTVSMKCLLLINIFVLMSSTLVSQPALNSNLFGDSGESDHSNFHNDGLTASDLPELDDTSETDKLIDAVAQNNPDNMNEISQEHQIQSVLNGNFI